ncbi:uncharacterized protein MONBRDRAFT_36970 [Monosiga brevicollis MX1]|uniref:Uncharacterized protein n=1 Tax=Monosiga brevicollis TaxID=81824 RepID=A9UYQ8_MONBE|nr:uncharacterized protein MONBRDRAFT_36970 [Monosiga brevicollis MX1]EDQ89504.1 predicted protein [Monosiga brevicollis MX1]|eukprot:XP_001745533.1 hypothetical protein [Monosiga brevicollis MX1]
MEQLNQLWVLTDQAHAWSAQMVVASHEAWLWTEDQMQRHLPPEFAEEVRAALLSTAECLRLWAIVGWSMTRTVASLAHEHPFWFGGVLAAIVTLLAVRWAVRWLYYKIQQHVVRLEQRLRHWQHRTMQTSSRAWRWIICVMPHIIFTSLFSLALLSPHSRRFLDDTRTLFTLGVIIPICLSLATLLPLELDDGSNDAAEDANDRPAAARKHQSMGAPQREILNLARRSWVSYWSALALLFTMTQPPFVVSLLPMIPLATAASSGIVLWLWLPFVHGCEVVADGWHWVLRTALPLLATRQEALTTQTGMITNIVVPAIKGSLPAAVQNFVEPIVQGGLVVVVAIPFFFSPRFIQHFGCALVGALVPAYKALDILGRPSLLKPQGQDTRTPAPMSEPMSALILHWLQYWVAAVLFYAAHEFLEGPLSALPFWYDAEIVAYLWLQLPYYRGAELVTSTLVQIRPVQHVLLPFSPVRSVQRIRLGTAQPRPGSRLSGATLGASPSLGQHTVRRRLLAQKPDLGPSTPLRQSLTSSTKPRTQAAPAPQLDLSEENDPPATAKEE